MFPQLFHIGNFALPTYGLLVALGVLTGLTVITKLAPSQKINPDDAWNLGVLVVLAAIVGAKLLLIINDFSWYAAHPSEIFSLSMLQAGGVFYGGVIAALLTAAYYMRKHHMPALRTCDVFAPGLALGHSIGRLGCFAAGCCYGKPTNHWWGVVFTNPLANTISGTPLGVRIQPTQLFESAFEFVNFLFLLWLLRHKKFEGQVIGAYLFLYGVWRFFIEFLRGDPDRGSMFGGAITGTQFISILLVIAGGILWWMRRAPQPQLTTAAQRQLS
ncbi:MAG TPA: prolipoprotein diacylglyceryl transferase [Terriglobales bacterium]|nr:prolipoprotein diacylglyceryl transferase [Terriglobales bacterium]